MPDALQVIEKKRDRHELTDEEISAFVSSYVTGDIPDYQAAALLMAVYLIGLTGAETHALTRAMLDSGARADLSAIAGPKVGKHSTGGVGDKVTLLAAPMGAACGVIVPKLSGRGLGHTGGTLDKLESIPGLRTDLTLAQFAELLGRTGMCWAGQTGEIAPADKKLYALRDVTGTVEHAGLIAASVMSKKLAEGLDALVLDVKCGRGAFMKDMESAAELARAMVDIGARAGMRTTALVTSMDQPLGACVGNSLEIEEVFCLLRGNHYGVVPELSHDLLDVSLAVAGHMVFLAGIAASYEQGQEMAQATIADGSALEKLRAMIAAQGGDERVVDDVSLLGQAVHTYELTASASGVVASVDALAVGRGCVRLGAGRLAKTDAIDPVCGVVLMKKTGDAVQAGETLAEIRYNDENKLAPALSFLDSAWEIASSPPSLPGSIRQIISAT